MSSLVSGISGGQPSTTQPIAIPWLSPKVVTRNMWPKVLKDILGSESQETPCGNARGPAGQMAACPVNYDFWYETSPSPNT